MHSELISGPKFRIVAANISESVLGQVAPDELIVNPVDDLLDLAVDGQLVKATPDDHAGGFGGADLVAFVVIPVVVSVLSDLLAEFGKMGLEELQKEWRRRKEKERERLLRDCTTIHVDVVIVDTHSRAAKKKRRQIIRITVEQIDELLVHGNLSDEATQ